MHSVVKILSGIGIASMAAIATPSAAWAGKLPVFDCQSLFQNQAALTTAANTTSTAFVNLPEGSINFDGGGDRCVIATFSAPMKARFPQTLRVRAKLDGDVGSPASADFYTPETEFDGRSVTFFFPSVPTGTHTIRLQFRSVSGGNVAIGEGLLTIVYDSGAF